MNRFGNRASSDTLSGIQILRAIAVLLVVFHHADWLVKSNIAVTSWPQFGAAGVDLFFVVSGFIIFLTTSRSHDPAGFMQRRLYRIVPLYWTATFLTFAIMCIDAGFLGWQKVEVVNLIKSLLFFPYNSGNGFTQPILLVGWSLNYEMFFYGLWALSVAVFPRAVAARVLLIGFVLAGLVLLGLATNPARAVGRFYTNPIMLEFAYGALLGWAYLRHRSMFARTPLALCVLVIIIALMAFAQLHGSSDWRLAEAAFAISVVAGVLVLEARGTPLHNVAFEALGNASYAIYLTHPLILVSASKIPLDGWMQPGIGTMLIVSSATLTTIIGVGLASFYLFERPVSRLLRDLFGRRPSASPRSDNPNLTTHAKP